MLAVAAQTSRVYVGDVHTRLPDSLTRGPQHARERAPRNFSQVLRPNVQSGASRRLVIQDFLGTRIDHYQSTCFCFCCCFKLYFSIIFHESSAIYLLGPIQRGLYNWMHLCICQLAFSTLHCIYRRNFRANQQLDIFPSLINTILVINYYMLKTALNKVTWRKLQV